MEAEEVLRTAVLVDRLLLRCRAEDVRLLVAADAAQRVGTVASVLSSLPVGAYLVGCGPYCGGVLPLTVPEVLIGRPPSPFETLPTRVCDYGVNDAVLFVPREASRVHVAVRRHVLAECVRYTVHDQASTTGTFVNGDRVISSPGDDGVELRHGDVLTLGPSGVNAYVFVVVE